MDKHDIVAYVRRELTRAPAGEELTLPQRARRGLIWFFAVFLLLTVLSRWLSAALVPQVSVKELSGGTIDQSVRGEGSWCAADASFQWANFPGLRVAEVFVTAGEHVAAGDKLYSFEAESVAAREKELTLKLRQYDLQIRQLQAGQGGSTAGVSLSLEQARQDLAAAQTRLDGAKTAIDAEKERLLQSAQSTLDTQQALRDGQLLAAQQAVDAARAALNPADSATQAALDTALAAQASLNVQWASALAEAEQAWDAARRVCESIQNGTYDYAADLLPYQTAVESAQRGVDTAQAGYDAARQSAGSAAASAAAQIASIQLERAGVQEQVDALKTLAESGFLVTAESTGTVTALSLQPGDMTTADSAVTLSTGGLLFRFAVSAEEAEGVEAGDAVTLLRDGKPEQAKLTVTELRPAEADGGFTVTCAAGDGGKGRVLGSQQAFLLERATARQELRVPIQALREDGSGTFYVLVLGSRDTVLGEQRIATRVGVELLSHDEDYAAVDGALSPGDKLIITSEKPIADGDRVEVGDA